jgi:predicted alpha/beta-fold hydrolase
MVDFLYTAYSSLRTKPLDPNFRPHNSIKDQDLINQKSDRLVVIFPWWHAGSGFFYRTLVWRLKRKGWAVLAYHFDPQILQADEKLVMRCFEYIQAQVTEELNLLKRKHSYKQIEFLGMSLGNISLC